MLGRLFTFCEPEDFGDILKFAKEEKHHHLKLNDVVIGFFLWLISTFKCRFWISLGAMKWFEMRRLIQVPPDMGGSSSEVFPVFAFRALHSTHMASREVFAFWLLSSMNFTAQLAVWPNIWNHL